MYPTPTEPGYYWAKLVTPTRMPEREDWRSVNWEVVHVFENGGNPHGDEYLAVSVTGVEPSQWVKDFEWGPRIKDFTGGPYGVAS